MSRSRLIPQLASGEWLASYALTEPGSGSDAGAMRTRAEKRGDTYVLNGLKHFITNAGVAHINTVFAVTGDLGTRSISAFVVEDDTARLPHGQGREQDGYSRLTDGGTGLRGLRDTRRQSARQ